MHTLQMLFGEPKDVARDSVVSALAYKQLASWLRCAEAMLRRLLLIEAAALAKPNTRQRAHKKRQRVRRRVEFWPDKPEDWRVSFRCFLGPPAPRRRARATLQQPPARRRRSKQQFRDAWPLALRYEALLRAYNNPEPYARRLAHRLRANPLGANRLLQAPPEAEHRIDDFEKLTSEAASARDRVCDSS